jgi:hypothetical protein
MYYIAQPVVDELDEKEGKGATLKQIGGKVRA